jgi:hypothetical protein
MTTTRELFSPDVLLGEASAALLVSRLATLLGFDHFHLEGDVLLF